MEFRTPIVSSFVDLLRQALCPLYSSLILVSFSLSKYTDWLQNAINEVRKLYLETGDQQLPLKTNCC